jgi:uncharacterized MnhB-related membrane protein
MKRNIIVILLVLAAVDWVTAANTYGNMLVRHLLRLLLRIL